MTPAGIFLLSHPQPIDCGDYQNRIALPGRALARAGLTVRAMRTHQKDWFMEALNAKVFWPQMLAQPAVLGVMKLRRQAGRPTVLEVNDDFFDFQPTNPMSVFFRQPWVSELLLEALAMADAVVYSSEGLRLHFSHLSTGKTLVAHNAVAPAPLPPSPPSPPFTVGMAVSSGHAPDLPALIPPLARTLREIPFSRIQIMCDPALFQEIRRAGLPAEHLPPMPYLDYREKLKDWHVFLLTGKPDRFNQGRSDGKWLDAARAGAVGLAPCQLPYQATLVEAETGFFYRSPEEVFSVIRALAVNPALWAQVRQRAYDYVMAHRTWEKEAARRLAFLELPSAGSEGSFNEQQDEEEAWFFQFLDEHTRTGVSTSFASPAEALFEHMANHPAWTALREEAARSGQPLLSVTTPLLPEQQWTEQFYTWIAQPACQPHEAIRALATVQAIQAVRALMNEDLKTAAALARSALTQSPHSLTALETILRLSLFEKRPVKVSATLAQIYRVLPSRAASLMRELGLGDQPL